MAEYTCTVDTDDVLDVHDRLDDEEELLISFPGTAAEIFLSRADVARLRDQLDGILDGEAPAIAEGRKADPLTREDLVVVLEIILGAYDKAEAAREILRRFG